MANPGKSVPDNVPGDFFVDTTCIDCDTCRQIAPQVFAEGPGTAFVHRQPASAGRASRSHCGPCSPVPPARSAIPATTIAKR